VEQSNLRQLGFNLLVKGTPNANRLTVSLQRTAYQSPHVNYLMSLKRISAPPFAAEGARMNKQYQGRLPARRNSPLLAYATKPGDHFTRLRHRSLMVDGVDTGVPGILEIVRVLQQ